MLGSGMFDELTSKSKPQEIANLVKIYYEGCVMTEDPNKCKIGIKKIIQLKIHELITKGHQE